VVIAAEMGFEAMDNSELEGLIDGLIADNPGEWDRFVSGDDRERGKMQGFFTGQIMKATKGQADGKIVNQILSARRSA
jgi:aspartyl-tRNA(Asn)/glutamyl-tRNA(Gln) amidotransferase subunit B